MPCACIEKFLSLALQLRLVALHGHLTSISCTGLLLSEDVQERNKNSPRVLECKKSNSMTRPWAAFINIFSLVQIPPVQSFHCDGPWLDQTPWDTMRHVVEPLQMPPFVTAPFARPHSNHVASAHPHPNVFTGGENLEPPQAVTSCS